MKVSAVCQFKEAVIEDDVLMCKWDLSSSNAKSLGCNEELTLFGMLKAILTPYNKLVYLELIFDVMSFMQQLRRATGRNDFVVVPNTYPLAIENCMDARVITEAVAPYRIVYVNQVSFICSACLLCHCYCNCLLMFLTNARSVRSISSCNTICL